MTTAIAAFRTAAVLLAAAVVCAACASGGADERQPGDEPAPTVEPQPGNGQPPEGDPQPQSSQEPGDDQQPAIERLAVVEDVELPTSAVAEENGRARLVAALPAGPGREQVAAVDLTQRLLVVLGFDGCSMTNPQLQWRGDDHLAWSVEDTGVNCFVAVPAIAVFALPRERLPDRVTLGGEQPAEGDLEIHVRR